MTFLDFFAGVGGFRRGMEMAGHECIGFCEYDKFAVASYTSMHLITDEQREYLSTLTLKQRQKEILKEEYRNGEWYAKDIRKLTGKDIPKADCWCFGAPCQSFSVAGKRAGLDGESGLIQEIFRILGEISEEDRPKWLIYENVKGMLSSNRGFDFLAILIEMDRWGYDIQWELLNSKHHGVPQNRERVYTIGHLRTCGSSKIFPLKRTDGENCIQHEMNETEIELIGHRDGYHRNLQVFNPNGVTETLSTCSGGGRHHHTIEVINNEISIPVLTPEREKKRQNGRRFKENGEAAFTLTGQDRHGVAIGIDDLYANRPVRFYKEEIPTMRSDRHGLKAMIDINVDPVEFSGHKMYEKNDNEVHALNCSDQRKIFGANQKRTMVSYNFKPNKKEVFLIDKATKTEEREVVNCISAREDRGLSNRRQEGTLVCLKV